MNWRWFGVKAGLAADREVSSGPRAGPAIAGGPMSLGAHSTPSADTGTRVPHRPARRWFILSGSVIAVCLLGLLWRGLNYSIDFLTAGR